VKNIRLWRKLAKITTVPADAIREGARTYAKADGASIVFSMGITQHSHGTDNVRCLADLCLICGQVGRQGTGLGQHVDISQQEVLASQGRYAFARVNQGYVDSRASRAYPIGGMLFCKDGFVEIMPMFRKTWDGLLDLLGNPEWANKEEYEYEKLMKAFGYKERGNEKIKQEVV